MPEKPKPEPHDLDEPVSIPLDPEVALRAVASLRALVESVEELQVRRARELGWSWQQIAALLGVSKQAVHQKFGAAERRPLRRRR